MFIGVETPFNLSTRIDEKGSNSEETGFIVDLSLYS